MIYPPDIDEVCVPLCDALNLFPGTHTLESCAGHGEKPFRIWFTIDTIGKTHEEYFVPLVHAFRHWYYEPTRRTRRPPALERDWTIQVEPTMRSGIVYLLEGPWASALKGWQTFYEYVLSESVDLARALTESRR